MSNGGRWVKILLCIIFYGVAGMQLLSAETELDTAPPAPALEAKKNQISYRDGLILGLIEGVTEYLPISSTGHLILTNELLGLNAPTPLYDKAQQPILIEATSPDGMVPTYRPFTLKDAAAGYAIIIQAGAIAAVILVFWQRILGILMGILGKNPAGLLLARNILCAFLPAAVLGLLLDDLIESYLFHPIPIVVALVAGALLMLWTEWYYRPRATTDETNRPPKDLHELSIRECLMVGLFQSVAMWPGTSRSMMTIVGGYVVGLKPRLAAEFSFLLGLVTLTAASGYKTLTMGSNMLKAMAPGPALFGIVVATIAAAVSVKWLIHYLTRHGLALFAWYRIVLAIGVTVFLIL